MRTRRRGFSPLREAHGKIHLRAFPASASFRSILVNMAPATACALSSIVFACYRISCKGPQDLLHRLSRRLVWVAGAISHVLRVRNMRLSPPVSLCSSIGRLREEII
jgi:hypothetical protein